MNWLRQIIFFKKRILAIGGQCVNKVLKFSISLRETFSDSRSFAMVNKSGKGALVKISTVFGSVYHVAC